MRVLSVVHQADAATGTFAGAVANAGAELVEWTIAREPAPAPPESFDAVLVFGGSAHPDQEDEHPWLRDELRLLGRLVEREVPLLGVCLGAQTLARALGARVGPAATPEIGWHDVELTPEGAADRVLGAMPPRFAAFQWHRYAFDLPPGGVALARNRAGLQAYRAGARAWGVQFHPEVDEATAAAWAAEDDGPPDPDELLRRTREEGSRWTALGRRLCTAFLAAARAPRGGG